MKENIDWYEFGYTGSQLLFLMYLSAISVCLLISARKRRLRKLDMLKAITPIYNVYLAFVLILEYEKRG